MAIEQTRVIGVGVGIVGRHVIFALHNVMRSLPTESLATIMLGRRKISRSPDMATHLAVFWSFSGRFLVVGTWLLAVFWHPFPRAESY